MPDLIDVENSKEVIIWYDELCASCKNTKSCQVMAAICTYTVQTYSGMHICVCDMHLPDKESEFYVPPGASAKDRTDVALKTLQQRMDLLRSAIGEVPDVGNL